jgi:hypothetical protein
MKAVRTPRTDNKVFCPGCGKQFLAIPGAECYCACGTAFRISLSKDGVFQLAVSRSHKTRRQSVTGKTPLN